MGNLVDMAKRLERNDPHRPSVINPADYDFVGYNMLPTSGFDPESWAYLRENRERIRAHMAKTGGKYSDHEHGGNCHVCGSVNAIYTATFHHKPTNTYIKTGLDCADKLGWGDAEDFRRKATEAREAAAGKRKAKIVLEDAGLAKAYEVYESDTQGSEEATIRDVVGKLVKYGNISDPQKRLLFVMLKKIDGRAGVAGRKAEWAAEAAAAAPVPVVDGRMMVAGKVLSMKSVDSFYGPTTKMLVKTEPGWKVWGTRPRSLDEIVVGDTVEFEARVTPSDRDPKFGFFSRPTKARVTEERKAA